MYIQSEYIYSVIPEFKALLNVKSLVKKCQVSGFINLVLFLRGKDLIRWNILINHECDVELSFSRFYRLISLS